MGGNMAQRLHEKGHTVFGSDPSADVRSHVQEAGVKATDSVTNLAAQFTQRPRIFWSMVPSGKVTDGVLQQITAVADPGDIVIDGGNSNYRDSQRRSAELEAKGLHFLDAGTSGGVWGLKNGYCLMVGGKKEAFDAAEPIFRDLAPPDGYLYAGPSGAGHFVKMVHNGIEYAMLQGYGEGFELMHAATEFNLDLGKISHLWNQGSVVRSWLLELAELAYQEEGVEFVDIKGFVDDSGEGRWTVEESVERAVPLPAISLALQMRFRSRQDDSYAAKLIAALRNQFGGHALTAAAKEEAGKPQPAGGHKDL
jgi:6-phosphogluconate dehydrogenase